MHEKKTKVLISPTKAIGLAVLTNVIVYIEYWFYEKKHIDSIAYWLFLFGLLALTLLLPIFLKMKGEAYFAAIFSAISLAFVSPYIGALVFSPGGWGSLENSFSSWGVAAAFIASWVASARYHKNSDSKREIINTAKGTVILILKCIVISIITYTLLLINLFIHSVGVVDGITHLIITVLIFVAVLYITAYADVAGYTYWISVLTSSFLIWIASYPLADAMLGTAGKEYYNYESPIIFLAFVSSWIIKIILSKRNGK